MGINHIFSEALVSESDESIAKNTLCIAEELTGSRFGFIGEINKDGRFDTIGLSNPGWEDCTMDGSDTTLMIKDMELRGIWATVLKSGATQIMNEPMSHPDSVGIPEGHPPLISFMGVPFVRHNQAVGMIALANKDGGYNEKDQDAVESLTGPFYEALLRKRLERQVRTESGKKEALADLAGCMSGNQEMEPLCSHIIDFLCDRLEAPTGLMYVADEDGALAIFGVHAHRKRENRSYVFHPGEGLVGQVARSKKSMILEDVPEGYLSIESGLGEMPPQVIYLKPILHNDRVVALLEMGLFHTPDKDQAALLDEMDESIAAAVLSAQSREIQARLLEESQRMTEELQAQQEELQAANEEMEEQTQLLTASESRLKEQQEELQAANEELEEKSHYLEKNKRDVEEKNKRLESLQKELTQRAEDLAIASKYKSEFLANMSHELRTPLNSLLLLSKLLSDNKEKNLSEDQLESVNVIYNSGTNLLSLINEILDLSKIEAGKMSLNFDTIDIASLADSLRRDFIHMAEDKSLQFSVAVDEACPDSFVSDRKRVDQVLKNLVSNAIKFTENGGVTITFSQGQPENTLDSLPDRKKGITITIEDTGIGIPKDKQKIIFEAFQQVETGSARKFGGTGLGLSISIELARLLDGEIVLKSSSGKGSIFKLYLPVKHKLPDDQNTNRRQNLPEPSPKQSRQIPPATDGDYLTVNPLPDDREDFEDADKTMLIIEDDINFGKILLKMGRERGFKCVFTTTGENGLSLAETYQPKVIILDIKLPGVNGWHVLERLKNNQATRHIPVYFMSVDEPLFDAFNRGAIGYLQKPVSKEALDGALGKIELIINKKMKDLLVIEDDENQRIGIKKLIGGDDVAVYEVSTGQEAVKAIKDRHFDCIILDIGLPDMTGFELLENIKEQFLPPVIVYTGRELTFEQEKMLRFLF